MKIQFFLSSDDIKQAKGILSNGYLGSDTPSNFCWGNLMILEGDYFGKCIFLEHIAIADFFCDFKRFLITHKNDVRATGQIIDMYESYGFDLEKQKDILTLKTNLNETLITMKFDYTQALHKVRFASQLLLKELIYHLPELDDVEGMRKMLM